MVKKPTYEELEQRVKESEKEVIERKRAEEALRRNEKQASAAIEAAKGFSFSYDIATSKVEWDGTIEEITGYTPKEFANVDIDGWAERIHPDDKDRILSILQEAFQRDRATAEYRFRTKDNDYVTFSSISFTEKDEEGKAVRLNGILQDITERKQNEKALQESEERFRTSIDNMSDAFAIFSSIRDETGKIVDFKFEYINEAGCQLNQRTREWHLSHTLLDLLPGHIETHLLDEYIQVAETGEPLRKESYVYEDMYGGDQYLVRALDFNIVKLGDGFISNWRDVSERKKTEEALQQLTHDLGERVKELNCLYSISKLVEQQDISLAEILQGTVDLIPSSWQYPEITCARVIIQGREWKTKNFRETIWKQASDIKVHSGLSGNLEVYCLEEKPEIDEGPFLREERNLIDAIAGMTERIVERKQAEEALRESKSLTDAIMNNSLAAIYIKNPQGRYMLINQPGANLLNMSPEEIVGRTDYDIFPAHIADAFSANDRIVLENRTPLEIEEQVLLDDVIHTYISVKFPVLDSDGVPILVGGVSTDITGRKQAEDLFRNLSQMLMEAQERERQMVSYELHDSIAQNLSALKIDCDTLFDSQSAISSELKGKMAKLSKTIAQTITAVRHLAYDLRPPVLDGIGLVNALETYCEDFSENSGIAVDFQPAGIDKLNLDIDTEIHLYRLVQEGLNNIRKHAVADQATIKLVGASPNIILRIEDDGKGFDVKARELALGNEKRMGIRSMKERTKLLQGEMELQSRPMQGTKISINLPYKDKKSDSQKNHIDNR